MGTGVVIATASLATEATLAAAKADLDTIAAKDFATTAKQDVGNASLSSIDGKVATAAKQDVGNASLSSIDAKVSTAAKQDVGNANLASIDGKVSTAAKQDVGNASLASIDAKVATETTLATRASEATLATRASEATLAAAKADLDALVAKDYATSAKQDTGNASLGSIDGKLTTLNAKDFATSAKQDAQSALLTFISGKDFSTETTLAALLSAFAGSTPNSGPDATNQSTTPLVASASFTGGWTHVEQYGSILAFYLTDQPTSTLTGSTARVEWSNDGSTVLELPAGSPVTTAMPQQKVAVGAATFYFGIAVINSHLFGGKYYRIKVTNGATPETLFFAIARLGRFTATGSLGAITEALNQLSVAQLTRSVLAGLLPDGSFKNLHASATAALVIQEENSVVTPAGSRYMDGIRDDVVHAFSASKGVLDIARLVNTSVGGTVAHDAANGHALFATGAAPGNTAVFHSEKAVVYEPGHAIRGEQSIVISALPTGDAFIEWGCGDATLANVVGWRVDAAGLYVLYRRSGVTTKVLQSAWNRDRCDANANSQFVKAGVPVALDTTKNNIYRMDYGWLGADVMDFHVKSPNKLFINTHTFEHPNTITDTTLPEPGLKLFIKIANDTTLGGDLSVKSGSWRGATHTNKLVLTAQQPDGDYVDNKADGTIATFVTPLAAGASVLSDWYATNGWRSVEVFITSDVPSAEDGVEIEITDDAEGEMGPPIVRAVVKRTFTQDDIDERGYLLFRLPTSVDGFRVRFTNNLLAAQATFHLEVNLRTGNVEPPSASFAAEFERTEEALLVQGRLIAFGATGPAKEIGKDGEGAGLNVHVTGHEVDTPIKTDGNFEVGQLTANSQTEVQIPAPGLAKTTGVSIANMDADTNLFFGKTGVTALTGDVVFPKTKEHFNTDGSVPVSLISAATGAATNPTNLNPASTTNNNGVVNPNNLLTSNDTRAVFDDQGDNVQATGFSTTPALPEIQSVVLKLEARKAAVPTTETAAFVDVVTGTAGNVGSVVSAAVAANAAHFYLVAVSRRNAAADVTSVVGLGLSWTQVSDIAGNGNDTRISLWKGTGTPTAGTVTANFSVLATNAVIGVYRFSGVDLASPIDNFESLNSGSATNNYSDSIVGTALGIAAVFVSMRQRLHTAGSGFTERNETRTGVTTSDASLAGNTLGLAVGGSQAYSGTLDGTVGWSLVAVTLKPAAAVNPVLTVNYKVGAAPNGPSSLVATLVATSDTTYTKDITADRTWTFADITALILTVTATTLGAADAEVDRVWVEVVETEAGATVRVAYKWIGS